VTTQSPVDGRNLVVVVLDSLRYDTFMEAQPKHAAALGPIELRYSYASWTAPAHYNLLTGLFPHRRRRGELASEAYKDELASLGDVLGIGGLGLRSLLPSLYLPTCLKRLGYRTGAMVSMPVLNPATTVNRDFDTYELMPAHNDLGAIIDKLTFTTDAPSFWLLNTGETHYPYAPAGEPVDEWPRVHGFHGAARSIDEAATTGAAFPDDETLALLRKRQVAAAGAVDDLLERLFDVVPRGTYVVVMSDHGELFGEDGCFGHGPVLHEKVFEVPFVAGVV
jgi:arylsulfatase A-like enzyme